MQGEWTSVTIRLSILGVPVTMKVEVPAYAVRARVMLPVFQQMSSAFAGMGTKALEASGKKVSCRAGCAACCRLPVPLTEIEIYHVAALVDSFPEPRRSEVRQRFQQSAQQLFDSGWYQRFEFCRNEEELKALAFEYFEMGVVCPFLEDENCSVYNDRPIICREYLVSSPSELCWEPRNEAIERVALPHSAVPGAARMMQSGNLRRRNFMFLNFALHYAEQYPESQQEKTGEEWLAEFFGSSAHPPTAAAPET